MIEPGPLHYIQPSFSTLAKRRMAKIGIVRSTFSLAQTVIDEKGQSVSLVQQTEVKRETFCMVTRVKVCVST